MARRVRAEHVQTDADHRFDGGRRATAGRRQPPARRRLVIAVAASFLLGLAVVPATAATTPSATPVPPAAGSSGQDNATTAQDGRPRVHAVVLVDESNSESEESVAAEAAAAGLIANSGQLDPSSKVAVIGFGTDDFPEKGKKGQVAAVARCPFAPVGSTDFRTCLTKLHKRTEDEGNGTDHAAAIGAALDILKQNDSPEFFNVIFLLTDGGLRVDNSPRYGTKDTDPTSTADRRNGAAADLVTGPLSTQAKNLRTQVWPVGFGTALNVDWMNKLATVGVGANPDCGTVKIAAPSYRYAGTAAEVVWTLDEALANATCQGYDRTDPEDGGPGHPVSLQLNIPAVASSATINAVKRNEKIKVTFVDPSGRVVDPTKPLDGSRFKLNTSSLASESLWISNPLPGNWTVKFSWPENIQPETVAADLTWLGQLSSQIRLVPQAPTPGQPATVYVTLQTSRNQPIIDSELLKGLTFSASLGGDGFGQVPVTLVDDGTGEDETARDATYSGRVTVPASASGTIQLTGRVSGEGLRATVQSAGYAIAGQRAGGAVLQVPQVDVAHQGDHLTATLKADNPGAATREIKIALDGVPGAAVSPASVTVPAGQTGFTQDLSISIAPDAAYGKRSGVLRALETSAGGQGVVLDEESLVFDVKAPPGFFAKYWYWFLIGLALLLVAVLAALVARARWRRAVDVSYLRAWASRPQGSQAVDLPAPSRWAPQFRFVLRDTGGAIILTLANPGDLQDVFTVRRAKHGQLTVIQPSGERRTDQANTAIPVGSGLLLRIEDRRVEGRAGATPPPANDPWGGGGQDVRHPVDVDPFGSYGSHDPFGANTTYSGAGQPGQPPGGAAPAPSYGGAGVGQPDPFAGRSTYGADQSDPFGASPTFVPGQAEPFGGAPTYSSSADTYGGNSTHSGETTYGAGGQPGYGAGGQPGGYRGTSGQPPGQPPPTTPAPGGSWGNDDWGNDPFSNS